MPFAAAVVIALAQAAPETTQWRDSRTERRIFEVPSRDAWLVAQARLKELGLKVDEHDDKNQALLTKWRGFSQGGWIPAPQLPGPLRADRIRFVVFVSPFVEPAHISVGSQAEVSYVTPVANTPVGHSLRAVNSGFAYNAREANQALMTEFDEAIAAAALPRLMQGGPVPCSQSGQAITAGQPIPLTVLDVPRPILSTIRQQGGTVVVDLDLAEDGGVTQLRVTDSPLARLPPDGMKLERIVGWQLESTALGAASLLLYSPQRVGGCPVSGVAQYTVRFR